MRMLCLYLYIHVGHIFDRCVHWHFLLACSWTCSWALMEHYYRHAHWHVIDVLTGIHISMLVYTYYAKAQKTWKGGSTTSVYFHRHRQHSVFEFESVCEKATQKQIISARDPNGLFVTSLDLHLLGLLWLFVCQDFVDFSSTMTSLAVRRLGLIGLFVC